MGSAIRRWTGAYPRFFYGLMLALLLASALLSFTVFRHPDKVAPAKPQSVGQPGDGFDRILRASEQLHETIALKRLVDSISTKKVLSQKTALPSTVRLTAFG